MREKVIILPKLNCTKIIREVLCTLIIGFIKIFISIGVFNTKCKAENCMKYIKSKFAGRLGVLKVTQDNPCDKWTKVSF